MKIQIIVLLMFFAQLGWAQDVMVGEVQQITSGNSFLISHKSNEYEVQIKDSEVSQNEEALQFLKEKILHKEVVLLEIHKNDELILSNAIMYNCKPSFDKESEIPCREANNLNMEMFMHKYLKYIGDHEFLKQISNP